MRMFALRLCRCPKIDDRCLTVIGRSRYQSTLGDPPGRVRGPKPEIFFRRASRLDDHTVTSH